MGQVNQAPAEKVPRWLPLALATCSSVALHCLSHFSSTATIKIITHDQCGKGWRPQRALQALQTVEMLSGLAGSTEN